MLTSACVICGSAKSALWLTKGKWQYRLCTHCSAVWLDPLPNIVWAESFYDKGYFEGGGRGGYRDYLADELQHLSNASARLDLAKRFGAVAPGTWVDVGCAAGYSCAQARNAGFTVHGVDLSPWARTIAYKRFGLRVYPSLAEMQSEMSCPADVVSMFQLLEHTPDPRAALTQVRACLRPGGMLLIETWDRGSLVARLLGRHWQQVTPPSVVWLFDLQSLTYLLRVSGFNIRVVLRTSKKISLSWAAGLLAEKLPRACGPALSRLARSPLCLMDFNYRLGDLVTVIAS